MQQFQARITLMGNIFLADNIVTVSLPVTDNDPQSFEFIKTYQVHSQFIFCQKCKNQAGCCIFWKIIHCLNNFCSFIAYFDPRELKKESHGKRELSLSTHCVESVQIRSFFWSVFSCIRAEYGDLQCKSENC